MAADSYSQEQYNVMSKFADLSELESSDEDGSNGIKKYSFKQENNIQILDNDEPKEIIHPTIPKNEYSKFDLTQFQDLSLLESSDDEANHDTEEKRRQSSPRPPNKPPSTPPPPKPKHSKAAIRNLKAKKQTKQSTASIYTASTQIRDINTKKHTNIKQNMAASVVRGVIGVTTKINAKQSKHKQHRNSKESTDNDQKINDTKEKKDDIKPNKKAYDICPFRRVLMFAMHLHLIGTDLPRWMVDVLTLFNDSNLKSCHEAASLGKKQRKLFVATVCSYSEPDNCIYVDTTQSIEMDALYTSWAIVNVTQEKAKYCDLKSIDGRTLHCKITDNHLDINKGIYLFFNSEYKREYLDFFLYSSDKEGILYFCDEYKAQQKAHIKKILSLDYDIENHYSNWFLSVYDKYLSPYDVNDCYELLATNVKYWKELILNKEAMRVQRCVDRTFVVKTMHSKQWIDDGERDYCAFLGCSVKFGVVQRKHHCRSCGDIFCKQHCIKELYRRNEHLESLTQSMYYNQKMHETLSLSNDDVYSEREMRICPDCRDKYHLFVDVPHKHRFMDCKCLKWNAHQIDFDKHWKIFISKMEY